MCVGRGSIPSFYLFLIYLCFVATQACLYLVGVIKLALEQFLHDDRSLRDILHSSFVYLVWKGDRLVVELVCRQLGG